MITHEETIKTLNKFRNSYYNSDIQEYREVAQALDVLLPKQEKKDKLLKLYLNRKKIVNRFAYDYTDIDEQIKALEEELK